MRQWYKFWYTNSSIGQQVVAQLEDNLKGQVMKLKKNCINILSEKVNKRNL